MEILPESDQSLVLEFMRLTPSEKKVLKEAEDEQEFISHEAINWS